MSDYDVIIIGSGAGGGMSLVGASDLAIAAEGTVFTFAFSKIGISPDGGSSYFLPRMMGMKKAFELAFLSDRFDAETSLRFARLQKPHRYIGLSLE